MFIVLKKWKKKENDEKELKVKEKIGKPVGQDLINNTPNFVKLLGEKEARKKSEAMVEKAIESLKIFGNNAKNLALIAKYSIERDM